MIEKQNIDELQKLANVFNVDNIITSEDIEQVLKGILVIMNSFKKDNQNLNKETKEVVNNLYDKIINEHNKLQETVTRETSDTKNEVAQKIEKSLNDIKSLIAEVKALKPKDGIDGKDADEERIIDDILAKIKLPEYDLFTLEEKGDEIVEEINSLPTDKDEYKIDASHIKNLPQNNTYRGGSMGIKEIVAGTNITVDNTNLGYPVINATGGGGGGTVDTVVAGIGITVDSTDPANPIVTSTITQYTDELAQDAVGAILTDSAEIDFTYNDGVPSITASIVTGSIDETKLDASVNASLDLADTAIQSAGLTNYFLKTVDDTDDITVGTVNKFATAAEKTKLGFITVTQAVDLDTIESDTATNNAKVTNATHTGDATGSGALTVVKIQGKDFPTLGAGDDQKYPKYVSASNAFVMTSIAGGGDVSKVGTPVNGQVGYWTGDGTLAGDTGMTYDPTGNVLTATGFVGALTGNADTVTTNANLTGVVTSTGNATAIADNALSIAKTSGLQTALDGKQPLDSDLTTIAGLTATTDNFIVSVASAWASRTPTQVRTTLGLVIGTNVQAWDADLDTWAGITPGTGVGTALAINVGSAGAFVTNGGALGTPSSGTVTNLTGTASININGTVGATTPTTGVFTTHTSNNLLISSNDAGAIGASGTAFSDLFLASGAVINFNAGNATLTHSAGLITSNVDIAVPDEAYGSGWNGSLEVPTKNAVYDKIETLSLPSCLSVIPQPAIPSLAGTSSSFTVNTNTTAYLYQFILPFAITVNKISIKTGGTVTTSGTYDLTIYSENGQTQEIAVTTASVATPDVIVTTAVSAVTLSAGMHYMMINSNSTADGQFVFYTQGTSTALSLTDGLPFDVTSEPVLAGTLTISAGTPPATFTPSSITQNTLPNSAIVFRLDN